MKFAKYVFPVLGALWFLCLFMPYMKGADVSLWSARELIDAAGGATWKLYATMAAILGVLAIAGVAISKKHLGRGAAAGLLALSAAVLILPLSYAEPNGILEHGTLWGKLLTVTPLLSMFLSIGVLIRPDVGDAAAPAHSALGA